MTALDDAALDALEEAAKGATPGPWTFQPWSNYALPSGEYAESILLAAEACDGEIAREIPNADGRHIATADPPTVLALVAEVRRLREVVGVARANALIEAADLIAAEARWQYEMHTRRAVGAQIVAQRMQMQERILRRWAEGAAGGDLAASQDPSGPEDADNDGERRSRAREGKR